MMLTSSPDDIQMIIIIKLYPLEWFSADVNFIKRLVCLRQNGIEYYEKIRLVQQNGRRLTRKTREVYPDLTTGQLMVFNLKSLMHI